LPSQRHPDNGGYPVRLLPKGSAFGSGEILVGVTDTCLTPFARSLIQILAQLLGSVNACDPIVP